MRVGSSSLLPALLALVLGAGAVQAAEFVGSESCRSCHEEAYRIWQASGHARAYQSLTPAQQKDALCVQCHAPDTAQGGEPGVSCESCHGAGEHYWPAYVMRDAELARATGLVVPGAKACVLCHDGSSPALEKFDAASAMERIDHWTAPRAAREGRQAEACERQPSGERHAAAPARALILSRTLLAQAAEAVARRSDARKR